MNCGFLDSVGALVCADPPLFFRAHTVTYQAVMADVVRAVSALLNSMAALTTSPTGQFRQDYQLALKLMVAKQKDQIASSKGEVWLALHIRNFLSSLTKCVPNQ